jgi:hypothetical protein
MLLNIVVVLDRRRETPPTKEGLVPPAEEELLVVLVTEELVECLRCSRVGRDGGASALLNDPRLLLDVFVGGTGVCTGGDGGCAPRGAADDRAAHTGKSPKARPG